MSYGGGGFFSSDSPATVASPSKPGGGTRAAQTLTPVTIKQLYEAKQSHPDDAFTLDGKELNQISIIGVILSVSEQSTNLNFEVDDGTGKIEVRVWLDSDYSNEWIRKRREKWCERTYVRVVGHLRSFQNQKNIVAFSYCGIQPLTDFNQLTHHFLSVIKIHLDNTRGAHFSQGGSNYSNQTLPPLHQQIIRILQGNKSNGFSRSHLQQTLRISAMELNQALETLSGEGHIYSTVDEDHFRTTVEN